MENATHHQPTVTDAEMKIWNDTLRSGDEAAIAKLQGEILAKLHTKMMDDDVNYRRAGYKPTTG